MSIKLKLNLLSIALIVVMFASWLMNFGWLRFVLTFALFPIIHSAIFFLGNSLSAKIITRNKTLKCITILSYITFLLPHILIYDGGDIGESYIFFHLIENNAVAYVCTIIGFFMLAVHFALLLAQYILYFIYRKKQNAL